MRTTNNIFSSGVSHLTDLDLTALLKACSEEMASRKERNAKKRECWIEIRYSEFVREHNAEHLIVGKRTIVAVYDDYNGVAIGTSYPIHGDEFDAKTGIAVAYAKAIGETVPDYI